MSLVIFFSMALVILVMGFGLVGVATHYHWKNRHKKVTSNKNQIQSEQKKS